MFHQPKKKLPILINKNVDIKDNDSLPLFLIHPGGGEITCYNTLGSFIDSRKMYGIEFPYNEIKDVFHTPHFKMEWLADLYAQKIMSVVQGPCIIGGWSAGGTIAYAITKRMEQLGCSIPLVVMIDSACPNVYREQKDKIAKVNYQSLMFYIGKLNNYFTSPVLFNDLEKNKAFDLNMYLPDLMCFVYEKLDIRKRIKKEISIELLDRFHYTIEGIVRAVLDYHITGNVENILFIKAEQSDISTANAWEKYSKQKMHLHEILKTSHLTIVEKEYVEQLKQVIDQCTENLYSVPGFAP
ncbi:MAG: hypothetical protein Tsb005_14200 [Gammaproteobacteria bacterium]